MKKRVAFNIAKKAWQGNLKPSRISGFSVTNGVVTLTLHEIDVVVVIYHQEDLKRLRNCCDIALL